MMYNFLDGNENIKAGNELRKNMKKTIMKYKVTNMAKIVGGTMAAMFITVAVSVNISPSWAQAMSKVPMLESFVRVVTFERYENKIGGSEAEIVTPKIEGLKDEKLMNEINKELEDDAKKMIEDFEKDAELLLEEYGIDAHMGAGSDYAVRTDTDDYYAIDIYYYNVVGSSSTTHKFYTVDKRTKELVTLKGLFREEADYVSRLSEIVKNEMIRRNNEEEGMFWVEDEETMEGFKGIKEDQNFFINENGDIVICFDKYEVAAGAQGCPEFVIEKELIKDILG